MKSAELTQRQIVLHAMAARPDAPWPRGEGHVPLGVPGSPRTQKAYHEPGGGFSPSPGSFGVSLWIQSTDGRRLATSDDIPLEKIEQRYEWPEDGSVPALVSRTPYHGCRWALTADGTWEGEWRLKKATGGRATVLIRSVGPAGGPINSLHWDGRQLIVNCRWVLRFEPAGIQVSLGDEREWPASASGERPWVGSDGWGYARVEMGNRASLKMTIRDTAPQFASPLTYSCVKSALELDLPDREFTASLEAQAANLLMGFVGRQTCPGEPTNYPLAWERDGAYSVVAMARCGQIGTAKELAVYFAENDYFGGFGAEGDAPGSAINAVANVARISGEAEFQRWAWPHLRRKAGLIEEMLAATETVRKPWLGPIVPCHVGKECLPIVCQPANDGLVVGSMDLHYPVLYVTAFSYCGLCQAATLAEMLGKRQEAKRWLSVAGRIQQAWRRGFGKPELANERTFMSAVWPTWIADPGFAPYRQALEERWERVHQQGQYAKRPLWTYFTVAEAHQWLFLDRPDQTWKTLRYFWNHQCSPGLYTYWEGHGEENSFGLWEQIRGWAKPRYVTPHYWTAAEMLLLQVDMLAYVNEAGPEPVLVIGGGVPREWLRRPLHVRGLPTCLGQVDWSWRNRKVEVTIRGKRKFPVRLGASFGTEVALRVR